MNRLLGDPRKGSHRRAPPLGSVNRGVLCLVPFEKRSRSQDTAGGLRALPLSAMKGTACISYFLSGAWFSPARAQAMHKAAAGRASSLD